MIDLLKKFFAPSENSEEHEDRNIWVATAAVFVEIATADGEFDDKEKSLILNLLRDGQQLSAELANEILIEAEKAAKNKIDLWQFTRTINKNFTPAQRLSIVENLWTLVLVDGQLDQHEEYLTSKLADLLHVNRPDFIAAKLKALRATNK
jgi:uncharacterized tellurite resistance protein B-like protein